MNGQVSVMRESQGRNEFNGKRLLTELNQIDTFAAKLPASCPKSFAPANDCKRVRLAAANDGRDCMDMRWAAPETEGHECMDMDDGADDTAGAF